MPEIKLGIGTNKNNPSYAQLYDQLKDISAVDEAKFREVFSTVDYTEEVGIEFNGIPINVEFAYIPVMTDGIAEVKVVKLEQSENIAIILPKGVAETYLSLVDDISIINDINTDIDLVGEVYNFDTANKGFQDFVKNIYINADNQGQAYRLTPSGEIELNTEDIEEDNTFDNDLDANPSMFDSIETDDFEIDEIPEVEANIESYNRFSRSTKAFKKVLSEVNKAVPNSIKKHIRQGYIAKDRLLILEVDNKAIYNTYNNLPQHAKQQLTNIGETIKLVESIQMVDSIMHRGKRMFILAENTPQNLWITKLDYLKPLQNKGKQNIIVANKSEVIELNRSNIRLENRVNRAYTYTDNNIAFIGGKRK